MTRREFLRIGLRLLGLGVAGGMGLAGIRRTSGVTTVWQIDPDLCVQCGNCAIECVLAQSAVKCVHAYEVCGYCDLCSGYYRPNAAILDTAAEHRLCPTGAISRTFIEDPYFEYVIDERLCVGCGRCVKACGDFGNGSLLLQISHDRCRNCNQCSIARACPAEAIRRVRADRPYLLKGRLRDA